MMFTRRSFLSRMVSGLSLMCAGVMGAPAAVAKIVANSLHRISGVIIRRGDSNYELWRSSMVWYIFKPDRYPDMIIRAHSEQDVYNRYIGRQ